MLELSLLHGKFIQSTNNAVFLVPVYRSIVDFCTVEISVSQIVFCRTFDREIPQFAIFYSRLSVVIPNLKSRLCPQLKLQVESLI